MSTTATFEEVCSIQCPKCKAASGKRCHKLAAHGGYTLYDKDIPHKERALAYFDSSKKAGPA